MDNLVETICKNYTRLANDSGFTDRFIAQKIEVTESTIQRWKNLKNPPSEKHVEALAKLFNISPFDFYKQASEPVRSMPVSKTLLKMMAIPDRIYEAAQYVDIKDPIWDTIFDSLDVARDRDARMESSNKSKK